VRQNSTRRVALSAGVAATSAVALLAIVAVGIVLRDDPAGTTADVATTAPPVPASTTTTALVVERRTLPTGTHELATARPDVALVEVRAEPPSGWDRSLTPVVSSADPSPPRSGLDVRRVTLPSAEEPIVGRSVTAVGWEFTNPGAYRPPQPLVFGVVERQGEWLRVQLPVRPNGTTGWLRAEDVVVTSTSRSIQVSLSERRLRVLDGGVELMDVPAGIGRSATPTPTGTFTVTDLVPSTNPAGGYGPVALALDGYSEVMDAFPGENDGDSPDSVAPVLAVHGTNRPSSVGADRSNGCPRLHNADVLRLAELTPAGTPVQIWP
jgi:lipoprotein-anchoring transpeptidase ErfK/SrfK